MTNIINRITREITNLSLMTNYEMLIITYLLYNPDYSGYRNCIKINSNRKSRAHWSNNIIRHIPPTIFLPFLVRRQNAETVLLCINECVKSSQAARVFSGHFRVKKYEKRAAEGGTHAQAIPGAHRKPFIVFNFTVEELTRKQTNIHTSIRCTHV